MNVVFHVFVSYILTSIECLLLFCLFQGIDSFIIHKKTKEERDAEKKKSREELERNLKFVPRPLALLVDDFIKFSDKYPITSIVLIFYIPIVRYLVVGYSLMSLFKKKK